MELSEIYSLLYRLGITANYAGFFHTSYGVYLAARRPESLRLVTKWLYPQVARHYGTTWKCVERNIRTAIAVAWETNGALLEELARHPLPRKPKPAEFLAILVQSLSLPPVA